jgi:hypothetical protein
VVNFGRRLHPFPGQNCTPVNRSVAGAFACDIPWSVTRNDAARLAQDFSEYPTGIEGDVDKESALSDKQRAVAMSLEEAKKAAGRYTIKEAAAELARQTPITADRWKKALMEAVCNGDLPLRNPYNYSDNLPYAVPKRFYSFIEQVDVSGLNRRLDLHPEWGVVFRFPVPAGASVRGTSCANAAKKKTKGQQWNEEIVRVLRELKYEPKSLPRGKSGKPGVRAEVARKLGRKPNEKEFEHAWGNALGDGIIAYES